MRCAACSCGSLRCWCADAGVYALAFYGAGDPIKLIFLRAPGDVAYDPVKIEAIREQAGLNRPFSCNSVSYIWNLLQGNFGNSLTSGRSVWRMIYGGHARIHDTWVCCDHPHRRCRHSAWG